MTKSTSRRKRESKLEKYSLDELSQLFFFPQDFAAKMLNVSTSTLKRRFNELKTQHNQPVKWPYFRDSYTFFAHQTHTYQKFSLTSSIQRCQAINEKGSIEYIINDTHIKDPRIIEAETLGEIFRAHVHIYRREKAARRLHGEQINENIIMNPAIMSIKRNSLHPWQSKFTVSSTGGDNDDGNHNGANDLMDSDEETSDHISNDSNSQGESPIKEDQFSSVKSKEIYSPQIDSTHSKPDYQDSMHKKFKHETLKQSNSDS